eukprot:scaffold400719_cov20-Prasinocladus_malaysianus.AAC.1
MIHSVGPGATSSQCKVTREIHREPSGTELNHMNALVRSMKRNKVKGTGSLGHFSRPFISRGAAVGVSDCLINSNINDQAGLSKATQAI